MGIAGERWGRVTVGASWGEVELHLKTVGSHCGGSSCGVYLLGCHCHLRAIRRLRLSFSSNPWFVSLSVEA